MYISIFADEENLFRFDSGMIALGEYANCFMLQ